MAPVPTIADAFDEFTRCLTAARPNRIDLIGDLDNGFEGWLKLEFFAWLVEHYQCVPGVDVGLEYKVRLDQRRAVDKIVKCCDLWVRGPTPERVHYVELKAPFANTNAGKVLTSAADDFWYMGRLRARFEAAATGNIIVLGVGFDERSWRRGRESIRARAQLCQEYEVTRSGELSSRVRWDVWTHDY